MQVNHINLGVTDVPATVSLLATYFGLRSVKDFPANDKMAFLLDDTDALISLFRVKDPIYPKIFHIGFMQDKVETVTAIHQRLTADGFDPEAPREEFGRYTFYFRAPGFTVEVNSFLNQADLSA